MNRSLNRRFVVVAIAAPLLMPVAVPAQTPSPEDRAAAVKQSMAANQQQLRQYAWVETTTITMKGEVKKQEEKQCYYGADGKVQKTPIPSASAPPQQSRGGGRRGGRLKQEIVEHKVDELKEYMERAAALVHSYVPPDPQKIKAGGGLTIADYLKPGDSVSIGFDPATKQLTSYTVKSYVDKPKDDDVTLSVTFGRLQDGTSYAQQMLLDVTAKKIQVKVVNSGYKKNAS